MASTVLIIIISAIALFILWKYIKPYTIKYHTTLFITGELGSGKTLHAVKIAIINIRKNNLKIWFYNKITRKIKNKFRKIKNKNYIPLPPKPKAQLYSNIPIQYRPNIFSRKRIFSVKLKKEHLLLVERIREYSIVVIDELPQLVNQFNWDIDLVQNNINEFITFFRHYIAGMFIITAQASNDVVVQIRRKCNQAIWCYNFKSYFFKLFYCVKMADMMLNDNIQNMSTTFIEDNTKKKWGLFPKKGTYDTRCFSERYLNTLRNPKTLVRWEKIKTNEIIRIEKYQSPLDDNTSDAVKKELERKCKEL